MASQRNLTVVLVGGASAGKSSCANSLAGKELFPTEDSECPDDKKKHDEIVVVSHEGIEYRIRIVDTIGLDDPDTEALMKVGQSVCKCREGINAVFFIVGKRIAAAELSNFETLYKIIGEDILSVTTVVRPQFKKFYDDKAVQADRSKLAEQKGPPRIIFAKLGSPRVLYVDNDPDKPKSMQKSRSVMLNYLVNHCKTPIVPPAFDKVRKSIEVREMLKAPSKSSESLPKSAGSNAEFVGEAKKVFDKTFSEGEEKELSVLQQTEGNEFSLKASIPPSLKESLAVNIANVEELIKVFKETSEGLDRAKHLFKKCLPAIQQWQKWLKTLQN